MLPKDFAEGLSIITAVFGDTPVKGSRLNRIKSLCDGRISGAGFIEICEIICDNHRYPPLPNDFDAAVVEWRKAFHAKTGRPYFEGERDVTNGLDQAPIDCTICNDLGVVMIKHRNKSDFESLMLCVCKKLGEAAPCIPEWDNALSGAYNRASCPSEWFDPKIDPEISDKSLLSKIWGRVEFWKNKQRQAEKHWASLGFKKV